VTGKSALSEVVDSRARVADGRAESAGFPLRASCLPDYRMKQLQRQVQVEEFGVGAGYFWPSAYQVQGALDAADGVRLS